MSNTNTHYYNQNAHDFSSSTVNVVMESIYQEFLPYVTPNGHILDAGCGSARDAKQFKGLGYDVTAMDASPELVKLASAYLEQDVQLKTFQQIDETNEYHGIWCCASLLHVPLHELPQVLNNLTAALKEHGVLYVSFKYNNAVSRDSNQNQREHNGRLFTDLNEEEFENLLTPLTELKITKMWQTGDNRTDRKEDIWLNAILTKHKGLDSAAQVQQQQQVDL